MKLLVLGGRGQVARALAGCDGPSQFNIVALGRPVVDITQPDSISAAFDKHQPDIVINAAAYTAVDQAESEQNEAFAINAVGAGNVAAQCARVARPLIHISTDYVFDGRKPAPYDETDSIVPLGVYGKSKATGEQRVAEELTQHLIVRTAWVHSSVGKNFVKTMLRLGRERDEVSVVNDQIGSPTYAPHLAEALCAVAAHVVGDRSSIPWGVYHAAGRGEATWYDVAQNVFDVSRSLGGVSADVRPITTSEYPTPAARPPNSRLRCEKLATTFNVKLPDWRLGVESCVRHLLEQERSAQDRSDIGSQ